MSHLSLYDFDHSAHALQPGPVTAEQIQQFPSAHALGYLLGTVQAAIWELTRPGRYPAQCSEKTVAALETALEGYDAAKRAELERERELRRKAQYGPQAA